VDEYGDLWLASVWNQARVTRLVLMSLLVRCAAWVCSPQDYRTTEAHVTAARTCGRMIEDLLASVPYSLGWSGEREKKRSGVGSGPFLDGEGEYGRMALAAYFVSWPLSCVVTQDYATDARKCGILSFLFFFLSWDVEKGGADIYMAERAYAKGRLKHIGDVVGIRYAHILSQVSVSTLFFLVSLKPVLTDPRFTSFHSASRPCSFAPTAS
jgi:hypothetical protein